MNQFLLALCGIPASGKSTLAKTLKDVLDSTIDVRVVSTDSWRNKRFYADFRPENERTVREKARTKTRTLIRAGLSVIHDDTNYYTSMRHELYDIALQSGCAFCIVYVSTPLDTALQWNKRRKMVIPEEVVTRIAKRFDEPGSKYTWDKAIREIDLSRTDTRAAVKTIVEGLVELEPLDSSEEVTEDISLKRIRDTSTRRLVHDFLKEHPDLRGDPRISRMRKEVLDESNRENHTVDKTVALLRGCLENIAVDKK